MRITSAATASRSRSDLVVVIDCRTLEVLNVTDDGKFAMRCPPPLGRWHPRHRHTRSPIARGECRRVSIPSYVSPYGCSYSYGLARALTLIRHVDVSHPSGHEGQEGFSHEGRGYSQSALLDTYSSFRFVVLYRIASNFWSPSCCVSLRGYQKALINKLA